MGAVSGNPVISVSYDEDLKDKSFSSNSNRRSQSTIAS